jgi:hypothetical protein
VNFTARDLASIKRVQNSIARLSKRYGRKPVLEKVFAAAPEPSQAGHPQETYIGNYAVIWAYVEFRRNIRGGAPGKITETCQHIAKDLKKCAGWYQFKGARLRPMYYEAKRKMAADPALTAHAEHCVKLFQFNAEDHLALFVRLLLVRTGKEWVISIAVGDTATIKKGRPVRQFRHELSNNNLRRYS